MDACYSDNTNVQKKTHLSTELFWPTHVSTDYMSFSIIVLRGHRSIRVYVIVLFVWLMRNIYILKQPDTTLHNLYNLIDKNIMK